MDLIWTGSTLMVSGPDTEPFAYDGAGGPMVGLRFDPGVAPTVFACGAHELRDARVALDDLMRTGDCAEWLARVAESAAPGRTLVDLVAARWSGPDAWVPTVTRRLAAGDTVADCAWAVGMTERTLHRRSLRHFGYGPKVLQRILRMRAAMRRLDAGVRVGDVVELGGYADYPHMHREFTALAGRGPLTFVAADQAVVQ